MGACGGGTVGSHRTGRGDELSGVAGVHMGLMDSPRGIDGRPLMCRVRVRAWSHKTQVDNSFLFKPCCRPLGSLWL